MSWKRRFEVSERERDLYYVEVVKQDAEIIDLENRLWRAESENARLVEERAAMKLLLWDVVSEGTRAKNRADVAEARVTAMLGQLESLFQALALDEDGGATVPTWVTDSVLGILRSVNE